MVTPAIADVTARIRARSAESRAAYLARIARAGREGPARAHLACSNLAHAAAAGGEDKAALATGGSGNLGIVTAYNDMLSAHQPFAGFPDIIRAAARAVGASAQVAGGVPAMCDGVTQGRAGMQLSLFSRDVIALSAAVALSHDTFDAAVFLGVCDKIVPGLVIAALSFGHLPAVFLPAGPMPSGLPNAEKARLREAHARGEIGREELLAAEMASYHAPGTCTFYGTANTNQMLMEVMGLHLPGASFVNPGTPLRDALTAAGAQRALALSRLGDGYLPVGRMLGVRAFVNGIAGLMATGGSTNLVLHLVAMARAGGIVIEPRDFADISAAVPLMARVYPNGMADVNAFREAGGLAVLIGEMLAAGLLHPDTETVAGPGLARYSRVPVLHENGALDWIEETGKSREPAILRSADAPFQATGGLVRLSGNLGEAVIKTSALPQDRLVVEARARVFDDPAEVIAAFRAGALTEDAVIVLRFQGPRANGMPELHALTPLLGVLQGRGLKVALVTDGRMSGASGKVPAAIHLTPEAAEGGPIARLRDGDMLRLDARTGVLEAPGVDLAARTPAPPPPEAEGCGRELFALFRRNVAPASQGGGVLG